MERLNPLNDYAFKQIMEKDKLMTLDSAIRRAEKKLEYISSDEEALALYRAREDSAHEGANLLYTGRMEGIEKGIEKEKIQTAQKKCSLKICPLT